MIKKNYSKNDLHRSLRMKTCFKLNKYHANFYSMFKSYQIYILNEAKNG